MAAITTGLKKLATLAVVLAPVMASITYYLDSSFKNDEFVLDHTVKAVRRLDAYHPRLVASVSKAVVKTQEMRKDLLTANIEINDITKNFINNEWRVVSAGKRSVNLDLKSEELVFKKGVDQDLIVKLKLMEGNGKTEVMLEGPKGPRFYGVSQFNIKQGTIVLVKALRNYNEVVLLERIKVEKEVILNTPKVKASDSKGLIANCPNLLKANEGNSISFTLHNGIKGTEVYSRSRGNSGSLEVSESGMVSLDVQGEGISTSFNVEIQPGCVFYTQKYGSGVITKTIATDQQYRSEEYDMPSDKREVVVSFTSAGTEDGGIHNRQGVRFIFTSEARSEALSYNQEIMEKRQEEILGQVTQASATSSVQGSIPAAIEDNTSSDQDGEFEEEGSEGQVNEAVYEEDRPAELFAEEVEINTEDSEYTF